MDAPNLRVRSPEVPPLGELRIFRLKNGESGSVRTLSELPACGRLLGCMTHHTKDGTVYCPNDGSCDKDVHVLPQQWKAYTAIEWYDQRQNLWWPGIWEITEHLEHVLAFTYQRGQVWDTWKKKAPKNQRPPLEARHIENRDPRTFPPAFDVTRRLAVVWRVPLVILAMVNPVPLPQMLPASIDDPPLSHAQKAGKVPLETAEERQKGRQVWEEWKRRQGIVLAPAETPQPEKPANGQHHAGNGKAPA